MKNLILVAFITFQIIESNSKGDSNWPSWRGVTGNGSAPDTSKPPREWSEEKNILWKLKTEGLGHSTPIVWENKLYYTSAIPVGEKRIPPVPDNAPGSHDNLPVSQSHHFIAVCVDKRSGKILWKTKCNESFPHEGGHKSGSLASASPVTDGKHLFAYFGSYGLYSINCETGKILWQRDFGTMATKHGHGEGSSPALKRHNNYKLGS